MKEIIISTVMLVIGFTMLAGPNCYQWQGKRFSYNPRITAVQCTCNCNQHKKTQRNQCTQCRHFVLPTTYKPVSK